MIRLRLAGGVISSEWISVRKDFRGDLHAIVESSHWPPSVDVPDIIVDVSMEDSVDDLDVSGSTAQAS